MADFARDRNLLMGVLALQMDFITRDQLIEALQSWLTDRQRNLEEHLLEKQLINQPTCQFLSDLAEKHLALHAHDIEQSLASLSSISSVEKALEDVQDPELTQTLERARDLRATQETLATGQTAGGSAADRSPGAVDAGQLNLSGANRFHVLRPYARGGLGIVSIAQDTELNREVALKEIRANYADDEHSRLRFMVEAEVTGRLEHPGIVPVYSLGRSKTGTPFYVMRFIRGSSLKDAIANFYSSEGGEQAPEDRKRQFRGLIKRLIDVCQAIDYAHSRGVLHRDLKPGNIMLGRYGETLVVDWGLAKSIGRDATFGSSDEGTVVPASSEGSTDTRFGSVVGTVAYMSPEQASGQVDLLGPRSDVYCLGATLYSILTGVSPIEKGSTVQMIDSVRTGQFVPVRQRNATLDPALAAVCEKAMALDPQDRYASAAQLMEDLERWLADVPVLAYPEPLWKRASRFAKRHRTWTAAILAVVVVSFPLLTTFGLVVSGKNRQLTAIQGDLRDLAVTSLLASENALRSTPGLEQFRNQVMQDSFDTLDRLHRALPDDAEIRNYLATAARESANQLTRTNQSAAGEQRMELAVALQRQILSEADDPTLAKQRLAQMLRDLSSIQRKNSRLPEAKASLDESIQLIGDLRSLDRDDLNLDQTEGLALLAEIGLHTEFLEYDAALQAAKQSVSLLGDVVRRKTKTDADITTWMLARAWEGRITDEVQNYSGARTLFEKAIFQGRNILQQQPGSRNFQYVLSRLLHWDARSSIHGFPPPEANDLPKHREEIDEAVDMMASLHADYPESEGFQANYGHALADQARIYWKLDSDLEKALEQCDQAIATMQQLLDADASPGNQEQVGEVLLTKAEILLAAGQPRAAATPLGNSLTLLESASQQIPTSLRLKALVERVRSLQPPAENTH